jgi:arabinose-5-phosphate isomerase
MCEEHFASAEILQRAREVLAIEISALQALNDGLGEDFIKLVNLCLKTLASGRKLVLCGVGKSGHISKKIAATLASTGSRAIFLHPVEAMHGDLGEVSEEDLMLAVSYSGETDELLAVLPAVKRLGVTIVAVTGNTSSRLSGWSDFSLSMAVPREACPFNLAPTATTTALAALGDALAMVLLHCRKFSLNDYAKLHPAGAIGRSITMTVKDCMRSGDQVAAVKPDTSVREALLQMTAARSGAVAIVDDDNKLLGIFTDGDFRRGITKDDLLLNSKISEAMTKDPITIKQNAMAIEIMKIIEKRKIDDIIAVDENGKFMGMVDVQDLPKFKMM